MTERITGSCYKSMMNYGISNLEKHCDEVNDLNVFPVPDGDTGTNMVMTVKSGICAIQNKSEPLSQMAAAFANATVFGARGNSGVIVSQFFKGMAESLSNVGEADCQTLSRALDCGCQYAYASVSKPVEGTILTVIRKASEAVKSRLCEMESIDDVISTFLAEARAALDGTPKLLPILERAGVVDSGGAGIVYFFEGIQKYLNGEMPQPTQIHSAAQSSIDYSAFNENTHFEFGYCTEALLQLTSRGEPFDYKSFVGELREVGTSIVTSQQTDKIKIHVHTHYPEQVLLLCHRYGEFLSLKIENMTVQHTQTTQKYLCAKKPSSQNFALVAVAPNSMLQSMLSDMGADVVIMSSEVPSSQDFIEAFERAENDTIIVFPNSANSILSAMQAASLYKKKKATILNCRSIAECYSALAIIDFESDNDTVVATVNDAISSMYTVSIAHATKNVQYGDRRIVKNDYFALAADDILFTADKLDELTCRTVKSVLDMRECDVINIFYGQNVTQEQILKLRNKLCEIDSCIELCTVPTQSPVYDLVLSFE